MKKRSKGEKRRQAAAVLAVFLAVLMVLGVLSPLFAAMAYGAEPTYQGEVQQADGTFEEVPSDRFAVTAEVGYEIDGVRRYIVQETTPVFFHVQKAQIRPLWVLLTGTGQTSFTHLHSAHGSKLLLNKIPKGLIGLSLEPFLAENMPLTSVLHEEAVITVLIDRVYLAVWDLDLLRSIG